MTLISWIDPADDNVVTVTSNEIESIADKSGNGHTVDARSVARRPSALKTINSKRVIDATQDAQSLSTNTAFNITGPDLCLALAYTDDGLAPGGETWRGLVCLGTAGGFSGPMLIEKETDADLELTIQSYITNVATIAAPGATVNNIDILVARYDAAADVLELIQNGQVIATAEDAAALTLLSVYLGIGVGDPTGTGEAWEWRSGDIGDVIAFDGLLRYDQVQQIEGFLAHKWDALAALPAGHPFKTVAPDVVVPADVLANFEGADGDTSYTAETGQAFTFFGGATLQDTKKKFGRTGLDSVDAGGVGNYFTVGTEADLTAVFTVECFASFDDVNQNDYPLIAKWDFNSVDRSYILNFNTVGTDSLDFAIDTGNGSGTTTVSVTAEAWTPVVGQVYHLAATCDGETLRLFIDGVLQASTPNALAPNTTTNTRLGIGGFGLDSGAAADGHDGAIDSVRIIKDRCLYVSDFTPPVRAFRLPAVSGLIANFNGQNNDIAYTSEDSGARVATFVGNADIDTAQKRFGHSSLQVDGTGDRVEFPHSTDFEFAGGDFDVEAWVRFSVVGSGIQWIVGQWADTLDNREWGLAYEGTANELRLYWSTAGTGATVGQVGGSWSPVVSTWYHVAVTRRGDELFLYVDGAIVAYRTVSATFHIGTAPLVIGGNDSVAAQDFNGHIDGVRIAKGQSYNAVVQVPEDQILDDSDLVILFDGVNGATSGNSDDANAIALTFNNGAQYTVNQSQFGSTCLDASTGNRSIDVPTGNGLLLGTGDFGIELWVRFASLPGNGAYHAIIDQRSSAIGSQVRPYLGLEGQVTAPRFVWYVSNANRISGTSNFVVINQWYHVVVQRISGTTRLYVDGEQQGADYVDANNYLDESIHIGARADLGATNGISGYIDALRWRVGSAIYPAEFTLPVQGYGERLL